MKLLQKGDKDPTNPNNYRPISLLSAIYKLASCAISNRIKKTLKFIIGKHVLGQHWNMSSEHPVHNAALQ